MWVQFDPLFFFSSPNLKYKSDLSWADVSMSSDRCRQRGKSCQVFKSQFYTQKLILQETLFSKFGLPGQRKKIYPKSFRDIIERFIHTPVHQTNPTHACYRPKAALVWGTRAIVLGLGHFHSNPCMISDVTIYLKRHCTKSPGIKLSFHPNNKQELQCSWKM